MYVKYQTTIHNDKPDKCTEPKFRDFLVQSPLLVSMIVFLSNCKVCMLVEERSVQRNTAMNFIHSKRPLTLIPESPSTYY